MQQKTKRRRRGDTQGIRSELPQDEGKGCIRCSLAQQSCTIVELVTEDGVIMREAVKGRGRKMSRWHCYGCAYNPEDV
eukprot:753412-Hanusia_phi.AAC.1